MCNGYTTGLAVHQRPRGHARGEPEVLRRGEELHHLDQVRDRRLGVEVEFLHLEPEVVRSVHEDGLLFASVLLAHTLGSLFGLNQPLHRPPADPETRLFHEAVILKKIFHLPFSLAQ